MKLTIFDPHLVVYLTCFVDVTAEVGSCPRKCDIRELDSVGHLTSFVVRDAVGEIVVLVVGVVIVVVGVAVDVVVVVALLSEFVPVLSIRLLGIPPLLEEGSGGIPPLSLAWRVSWSAAVGEVGVVGGFLSARSAWSAAWSAAAC